MLRIEKEVNGPATVLRLIGRMRSDCVEKLQAGIERRASFIVLDLAELQLVDLASVRFLRDCEERRIELRNCPPYIREWIRRERAEEYQAL